MSPLVSRMLQLLELVLLQAALLFISAGNFRWSAGWWYLGLYVALLVGGAIFLIPPHGAVINERSKGTTGARRWDLWIIRLPLVVRIQTERGQIAVDRIILFATPVIWGCSSPCSELCCYSTHSGVGLLPGISRPDHRPNRAARSYSAG